MKGERRKEERDNLDNLSFPQQLIGHKESKINMLCLTVVLTKLYM